MRMQAAALFSLALLANAAPLRADAPAPEPADIVGRVRAMLGAIAAGKLDRTLLTPDLNAVLTDPALAVLTNEIAALGPPATLTVRSKADLDGVTTYTLRAVWPAATLDCVFGIDDASGKIAKLYLVPGPPS